MNAKKHGKFCKKLSFDLRTAQGLGFRVQDLYGL